MQHYVHTSFLSTSWQKSNRGILGVRMCCCSYPGAEWGWQNLGTGYQNTWTGSATMCSPHSYGNLSVDWHCGSVLGLMRHNNGMSVLNQSAYSILQVGSHTRLMSPLYDWRRYSQTWACNGSGSLLHHSRSPLQPRQRGGSEGKVESPGEKTTQ